MTLSQLLAAIQRELDSAPHQTPRSRRTASDVLAYQVAMSWGSVVGHPIQSVAVNHDQQIVWLET